MDEPCRRRQGEGYGVCDDEVGGGGSLIRHFGEYDASRVTLNSDICATAKGYERMLEMKLRRGDAA